MTKKQKIFLIIFLAIDIAFFAFAAFLIAGKSFSLNFAVLNPKGVIAAQERTLLATAVSLMLIAVVPVYFLIFFFAWKYRAGKTGSKYSPNMDSKVGAWLIWLIPGSIIFLIGILNWKSTHALDPYKPLISNRPPLTIQVVALRWKWLFIYPDQRIATVNYIKFPAGTPLNFRLTADAPMNIFWIPQLGGQVYAMPGMSTQLHLMADGTGTYNGSAAEINGAGFAGMRFKAESVAQADFDSWIKSVRQTSASLTPAEYNNLSNPSENNPEASYVLAEPNLFNDIMIKFMGPPQIRGMGISR